MPQGRLVGVNYPGRFFNKLDVANKAYVVVLGYKVKDYLKPYEESQVKGIGLATSFFETFLEPVQVNFSRPGDILVLKNKKVKFDLVHFGIECANSQVIVALNKKSVEVLDKKYFDVIGAYTWAGK